ncbi:MAG: aminotransferase class V-fold PLP-dependent enzyme [Blastocatellia bacterium]|nr:aminotransferase class V-fold PLP-dependent enzyme [Blastocatellia bacterium]
MDQAIRKLFPATERFAYLNSAAVSPMPQTAIDAVTTQLNDVARYGSEHYPEWIKTKNRARALVAGMLGVGDEQVAFMRNTSDGIAAIAAGLDWKAGDNIATLGREFPANFYPWRNVRDEHGVEMRIVPERDGRYEIDELIAAIDGKTKVVAVSAVQFGSGFRADLERIGKAAREHDALFVVDVIQGLGAMGFDLPAQYVDAAAGASHKWLSAPEGMGVMYLSDRARDRIKPAFVGWISVETPWDFDDLEQPFKPNALAWESGTGTSSLFYGLEQSLKLLTETGLTKIDAYLDELSTYLCERLADTNYHLISSRERGERSAIVCVKHRGGLTSQEIYEALRERDVIVSARGDRLRFSPHFYNNKEDIDRLMEALPD